MVKDLVEFRQMWDELWKRWRSADVAHHPLDSIPPEILLIEAQLKPLIGRLLNVKPEIAEELFASAREVRDANVGREINLRAGVDISNVCRVNCGYCPMRRDNLSYVRVNRATVEQIILAARSAHMLGFRQLFLQSGEDPLVTGIVMQALRSIVQEYNDWHMVLNLGNLSYEEYQALQRAGAHGYLIKHETINAELHWAYRQETVHERVRHMLLARQAGLYIGSGIILGLPKQTDEDLTDDLIFFGRLDSSKMASCAPFTPSKELPSEFRMLPPGNFEKTKRFIALLRHCFPSARIPATSNLDSTSNQRLQSATGKKSGQAEVLDAGANGITVQFTPVEVEQDYGLYERGFERHMVYLDKAEQVAQETNMVLDLVR